MPAPRRSRQPLAQRSHGAARLHHDGAGAFVEGFDRRQLRGVQPQPAAFGRQGRLARAGLHQQHAELAAQRGGVIDILFPGHDQARAPRGIGLRRLIADLATGHARQALAEGRPGRVGKHAGQEEGAAAGLHGSERNETEGAMLRIVTARPTGRPPLPGRGAAYHG